MRALSRIGFVLLAILLVTSLYEVQAIAENKTPSLHDMVKKSFPKASPKIQRRHPPQDQMLHDEHYQHWMRKDEPGASCCSEQDCYPTYARIDDEKNWWAKRREDGKMLKIPRWVYDEEHPHPTPLLDGRAHLCAPGPDEVGDEEDENTVLVYCFKPPQLDVFLHSPRFARR